MNTVTCTVKCDFSYKDGTLKINLPRDVAKPLGFTHREMLHNISYVSEVAKNDKPVSVNPSEVVVESDYILLIGTSAYILNAVNLKEVYVTYTAEIN